MVILYFQSFTVVDVFLILFIYSLEEHNLSTVFHTYIRTCTGTSTSSNFKITTNFKAQSLARSISLLTTGVAHESTLFTEYDATKGFKHAIIPESLHNE